MARNDYKAMESSSPPLSALDMGRSDNTDDMQEGINALLIAFRDVIDERIEKRIRDGQDIAQVYTAEITNKTTAPIEIGKIEVDGTEYSVTRNVVTAVTVRYNDEDYVDISNDTVRMLNTNDKWCKICTYDGVQFYVLHRI